VFSNVIVPLVLSVDEMRSCLGLMSGTPQLATQLIYGAA